MSEGKIQPMSLLKEPKKLRRHRCYRHGAPNGAWKNVWLDGSAIDLRSWRSLQMPFTFTLSFHTSRYHASFPVWHLDYVSVAQPQIGHRRGYTAIDNPFALFAGFGVVSRHFHARQVGGGKNQL